MIIYILIIIACIILDQITKWMVLSNLELYETTFKNPILSITHIRNEGGAWSIFEGHMWFFLLVGVVALCIFSYLLYKNRSKSKWLTIGLSFVIGGTIGNFIDRFRQGYVVDMFQTEFIKFPIFNVADICLVVGVICIFIYILFFDEENKNM